MCIYHSMFITDGCSWVADLNITATIDSTSKRLYCNRLGVVSPVWIVGTDLCDMNGFTSYDNCNSLNLCNVPSSDYLMEPATTYFCCHSVDSADDLYCIQITSECM